MFEISDEAVEAAFDAVGMRIKVLPEGSPATGRDVCYEVIKAALPHLPRPTLLLSDDDRDPPKKMLMARIRELEAAARAVVDLVIDDDGNRYLRKDEVFSAIDALCDVLNQGGNQ